MNGDVLLEDFDKPGNDSDTNASHACYVTSPSRLFWPSRAILVTCHDESLDAH